MVVDVPSGCHCFLCGFVDTHGCCVKNTNGSFEDSPEEDALVQVNLTPTLNTDFESWAHCDTEMGVKGEKECAEYMTFLLLTAQCSNHIVH